MEMAREIIGLQVCLWSGSALYNMMAFELVAVVCFCGDFLSHIVK